MALYQLFKFRCIATITGDDWLLDEETVRLELSRIIIDDVTHTAACLRRAIEGLGGDRVENLMSGPSKGKADFPSLTDLGAKASSDIANEVSGLLGASLGMSRAFAEYLLGAQQRGLVK